MTLTDKARAGFASITIRGGRITKWKGQAASYSPQLGSLAVGVSGAALAAALAFTPGAALAGDCVQIDADEFLCAGPATPGDATETISVGPIPLTVTTSPGFGHSVTSGPGIVIESAGDYGKFEDLNNSTISGTTFGVDMASNGTSGLLRFQSTGSIAGTATGSIGIDLSQNTVGLGISARTNNSTGDARGIRLTQNGTGSATLSSNGTASGTGAEGIGISAFGGTNSDTFLISARIASGTLGGIAVTHSGASGLELRSTESATGQGAASRGISVAKSRGDSLIEANNTQGGEHAIRADTGGGYLTIRSSGLALATASDSAAISVTHAGTAVSISANNSTGGQYGIEAINEGTGALSVTSTGLARATSTTIDPLLPNGPTGIFAQNAATGTDLSIVSNDATGHRDGIRAINNGTGMLSITSVEDEDGNRIGTARGTTGSGIVAENAASGIGMTIAVNDAIAGTADAEGVITGGIAGINATNRGTAAVPTGSTATNGLTITANNAAGGQYGIRARNEGTGALSVTSTGLAQATSTTIDPALLNGPSGIFALNSPSGTDVTITANNTIGERFGIRATNNGTGDTAITSQGTASGASNDGISVTNAATAGALVIDANITEGGENGIYARNLGRGPLTITSVDSSGIVGIRARNSHGDLTITSTGTADGTLGSIYVGSGIFVQNGGGALTINSNTAIGNTSGIEAINFGTGSLTIRSGASSTSTRGFGIYAYNGAPGNDLIIEAATTGGSEGITAVNNGRGNLSITSNGTATGTFGSGIFAQSGTYGSTARGSLTITATNSTGGRYGIVALQYGSGSTTITSTGLAEATGTMIDPQLPDGPSGIVARNAANGSDVTITANDTSGTAFGIRAINNGTGVLSISSVEDEDGNLIGTARSTSGTAIFAENAASGIGMTIAVNDAIAGMEDADGVITGGVAGINAVNRGTAMVPEGSTATNGLTITANNTTGGQFGIRAFNEGAGALSVTATGTVTGATGQGILAVIDGPGTDLAINARDVTGGTQGIEAANGGTGDITINARGTATGNFGAGIVVTSTREGPGGDITINAENAIGNAYGVRASNGGSRGTLEITTTGTVSGGLNGIQAYTRAAGGITIDSAGATSTGLNGIFAQNLGSGATSISSSGMVRGGENGVEAFHGNYFTRSATDLTINVENTEGTSPGGSGIFARHYGSGALSITSTGLASGGLFGIFTTDRSFYGPGTGTDVTVISDYATGRAQSGIRILATGAGKVSVTSNGTAQGGAFGDGITVISGARNTELTIDSNDAIGGYSGIRATHTGSGMTTITSRGAARGATRDGIYAANAASGIGMAITVNGATGGTVNPDGSITGGRAGIYAINRGTAAVPEGSSAANGLSITANDSIGGQYGIRASNEGTGALTIRTTGQTTGLERDGISVLNRGTDLIIEAADTSGRLAGIGATNSGSGVLSITSSGLVQGQLFEGIAARNNSGSGLSVTAEDTTGTYAGILTENYFGALDITSTGTATARDGTGIVASNFFDTTTSLTIQANNTSGNYGITATNYGTGMLTITSVEDADGNRIGTARGTTGSAIFAQNNANGIGMTIAVNDAIAGVEQPDGSFTGGFAGINAVNRGTAAVPTGSTATNGLTISANNTTGGVYGIRAVNEGTGALTITSTGLAQATLISDDPMDYVASTGILAINVGTDLTITATDVTGQYLGIFATNNGTGALSITTTGTVTGVAREGIFATSDGESTSLTIRAADTVGGYFGIFAQHLSRTAPASADTPTGLTITSENATGGFSGIFGRNTGNGALSITSTGTATGTSIAGIVALNDIGTTTTVIANETVGRQYGILAANIDTTKPVPDGSGGMVITSANATGGSNGIYASNGSGGSISITSTGLAQATGAGYYSTSDGRNSGISARNSVYGSNLTIAAQDASGGRYGILARNSGSGMTTITSDGTAQGAQIAGIFAENAASGIGMVITANDAIAGIADKDGSFIAGGAGINAINRARAEVPEGSTATNGLTISANNTIGAEFGIRARHYGTGALTITSAGTATATELRGLFTTAAISAEAGSEAGGLIINSFNASGAQVGIIARHSGSGILSVTSTGLASGAASRGIFAVAAAGSAADVVVTSQDAYGRLDGIFASQGGSGTLTVNSKGTASASATLTGSRGISVSGLLEATDITVNAVSASGRNNGIFVGHYGIGSITVTATGDVTGNAAIVAAGGGRNVRVDAFNTSGTIVGIAASNRGTGFTEIVSRGVASASGPSGDAIRVTNVAGSTSMSVTSNIATGGLNGIAATNSGTGALTITSQGAATGINGSGITATNGGAGSNLTINAGDTTGGNYGIRAINDGSGALTITSTGSARGTALDGIYAVNAAAASAEAGVSNDTTVIAVNSAGGRTGIRALHDGAGALSVTSTGLAEGTGSGADGIYARGRNGSSGVTIASNKAAGDRFGILARNGGGGVLTVTSTGLAEGGSDDGINAATLPGGGATDIVVAAQDTSGGRSGLRVIQNGTGVVRVDSKGHANGTRFRGIDVGGGVNSSGVIVNAASATGGINGIFVGHYGTGTVTVTATGDITGFNALVAANAGDNTRVTAVNTIGSNVGISADARGNGVVEVVSTGTASASDARGRAIELSNRAGGTAMSLASNNAVGGLTGIRARNAGVGAITILSSGNAVGEAEDGILAVNEASATNITITANATSGGITGINAQNNGTGALAITTSGATSGTAQTGIDALNRGTSLAITTGGAVTGGVDGIRARNYGTGGLTIIANGDVTGGSGAAINAFNSANDVTASMLVEQAAGTSFTGATDGIIADNAGGSLTVNALGTLVGTAGSGVNAINQATATGMTLRVNNASGAVSGIAANNQGTGPASITLTGTAQGGSGAGIDTVSAAGNLTTITLAAGARALAGASGVTISNNAGNANLNVASGASVVGEVRMGGGSDTATFSGAGALAGITVLDGGDDIDALTLNGVVATLAASRIINWESLAIAAGADVAITGLATGALSVTDSTAVLTDLVSGTVTSSNAQLTLNGATTLAGVLTCGGTLTVAGASAIGSGGLLGCAAADTITVSGDARVAGNIEGAGGADVIAVLGNASVTGAILGGGAGADNSGAADGSDTITIDTTGSVARIDSGLGDDVIALRGGTVAGDVLGGGGNDAVTLSGARIAGAIDAGAGADVITLSAGSAAAVLGNDGNDAITLAGATITGALDGGAGDDGIALSGGSADTVLGGTGNDTIALTGAAIAGAIDGGAGADVLALSSGSAASVSGGDGNDAITLSGATITGALDGGVGNDVIALDAGSAGSVLGGEGDDRVRWNAAAATTTSIQLGAGADTLDINSAAISLASVTLDGGEGDDTLNLNASWTGDLVGARTTNWDVININGGTIRISDSALTAGLVNVNESGRLNASNNLALTGNLAIAGGGRLLAGTAAGNNAAGVSGNLANGGLIDLRGPGGQTAVGDRLTIGGNLTGLAGSSIRLDAVLGASQTSDLIVVRGNLSGSGEVIVNNVGGIGALTTGDGIRLVQVDGTSAAGALTLAGGTIDVGAFRYALQNGGLADPGDSDWYLRSRVRDIVVPTISIARLAQDMSLAALGTLNQRTGEQQHLTLQSGDSGFLKGMWGRALGKDYSETVQSVGLGDVSTEGRLGGLQAGVDLYRAVAASGSRTSIGVFGGHLWSSTSDVSFSGFARSAGTTNSDGWILGGYVTHVAASGWYVDAVVQRDWLDHRANAADGTAAATQSRSTLASLEVGKAFGKVWKFEPQAQLIYGDTRIDAFADSRGIANRLTVEDNVIGRGGFRLKRTWDHDENSDGGLFTVYAKANIWGRLDGGAGALSVGASVPGALQMREVWGDVGFGTTFSVARNAEFFSEFDVEYGIDQGGTALAGQGGFRLRF